MGVWVWCFCGEVVVECVVNVVEKPVLWRMEKCATDFTFLKVFDLRRVGSL
jgi:hypothetical protein